MSFMSIFYNLKKKLLKRHAEPPPRVTPYIDLTKIDVNLTLLLEFKKLSDMLDQPITIKTHFMSVYVIALNSDPENDFWFLIAGERIDKWGLITFEILNFQK